MDKQELENKRLKHLYKLNNHFDKPRLDDKVKAFFHWVIEFMPTFSAELVIETFPKTPIRIEDLANSLLFKDCTLGFAKVEVNIFRKEHSKCFDECISKIEKEIDLYNFIEELIKQLDSKDNEEGSHSSD